MYVTETHSNRRETVRRLYSAAIRSERAPIVLCDTVGHATPQGAYNLLNLRSRTWLSRLERRFASIGTGHCDLDCDRHSYGGAAGRISPLPRRIRWVSVYGNTPMELMLVNLRLMGFNRIAICRI